jgi:hypothetical protein
MTTVQHVTGMSLPSGARCAVLRTHGLFRRDQEPSARGNSPVMVSRNHRWTWSSVSRYMYMRQLTHIQFATVRDTLEYFCFDNANRPAATGCFRFCTFGQRMLLSPHCDAKALVERGHFSAARGQRMVQTAASGCFKSQASPDVLHTHI